MCCVSGDSVIVLSSGFAFVGPWAIAEWGNEVFKLLDFGSFSDKDCLISGFLAHFNTFQLIFEAFHELGIVSKHSLETNSASQLCLLKR